MISENLKSIQSQIQSISKNVTLVGVTKFAHAAQVQEAINAGLEHIGENRVQDAAVKFSQLKNTNVVKHLIGHLQSNKAKQAVELFDVVESVDSLKILNALEKEATKINKTIDILIQVNTSGEAQKFGVSKEEAMSLIEAAAKCAHLKLKGLMTIAPLTDDEKIIRQTFRELKVIFESANVTLDLNMTVLSMGMSSDFEIALEEGANVVRIGSAIFQGA